MKLRSVNKKFLGNLKKTFGKNEFTTKQAEGLYIRDHAVGCNHWKYPDGKKGARKAYRRNFNLGIEQDDYWQRMSARNTLVAAVQHGLLKRIEKGFYRF